MPHIHAKVLVAISEGKDVQWKQPGINDNWVDMDSEKVNPITNPKLQWRVKPKSPKQEAVNYYLHGRAYSQTEQARHARAFTSGWEALGKYLVEVGLVDETDIPE